MNPKYDAGNNPVNHNISLADESFLGSGGGGINVMGSEFAWSPSQRYQMISRTSDPINSVCLFIAEVLRMLYLGKWQMTKLLRESRCKS